MKNFLTPRRILLIGALALLPTVGIFAQCKGFVKKQIPKLSPFIHNGQVNSSVLLSGDEAELTLTFYSGQTYRILVSAQEVLGGVYFVMKDAGKAQLFSSKGQEKLGYWDFSVESTQQITVQVIVPNVDTPSGLVPSGCVSILVGFKQ